MPNGDPEFDFDATEAWFAPISKAIEEFAGERNLYLEKYYHDSPCWYLRFQHPRGGQASIQVGRSPTERVAFNTCWHVDDYEHFTRHLHWREQRECERESDAVARTLENEFAGIIKTPFGVWNKTATGYERIWGRYSKEEFDAMGPHYPSPEIGDLGT